MAKTALVGLGKILLLTVAALVINVLVGFVVPIPALFVPGAAEAQAAALIALGLNFVFSVLFYCAAVQADVSGWRLYLGLLCIYAGFQVVMTQVETLIFLPAFVQLTASDVWWMILNSLVSIALYLVLVVWVAGRWRSRETDRPRGGLIKRALLWKIALLAAIYPLIYYVFGYFVAWQFEAVQTYYNATPVVYELPLLLTLQVVRGAAWALLGLPIFWLFRENRRALVYAVLFYALLPSLVLLHPNPLMPEAVRYAHLLEMTTSMALLGLITGFVMTARWGMQSQARPPRVSSVGGHA